MLVEYRFFKAAIGVPCSIGQNGLNAVIRCVAADTGPLNDRYADEADIRI